MDSALLELQKDLAEVKQFLEKATRKRVRDALFVEQRKLETEISNKQQQAGESMDVQKPSAIVPPMSSTYTVKISNYGWDQSDKFIKIYITLKDVQNIPVDNVQVNFGERSFELFVKDLNGKNHTMTINNLLKPIMPDNSSRKVKTDTILLMLKKKSESKWEYLTQVEKQTKEKDKPSLDTDADPSAGLMNVLKKMYDEGDDEMKRTLNKAWVESQEKQKMGGDMDI